MPDQEVYDRTLDAPPAAERVPGESYDTRLDAPRRPRRRSGLGLALVVIGLVLLGFQVFGGGLLPGGSAMKIADQTLPGDRIELTTTSADVEVRTWSGSNIHVEATQRGGSRDDYTITIDNSGNTVRVTEARRSFFCIFCDRDLSYRISVPASAQARITTASGDIDVEGLAGAVELGTVSGDVRADELAGGLTVATTSGEVRLQDVAGVLQVTTISGDVTLEGGKVDGATVKTTSGEIDLDGAVGPLDLGTVSGDISVRDAHEAKLTLATTSGDIDYEGDLARDGANQLSTISGDVKLRLPDTSGFRLDASTVSGEMHSDFDLSGGQAGLGTLDGQAGDGGASVNVNTTSGEISLERR
jgi:hypothetical protein